MRNAAFGQPRERNPRRHVIGDALEHERFAEARRQDYEVRLGPGFEDAGELRVKGYPELRAGLALHHANGAVLHILPAHSFDVGTTLPGKEEEREGGSLARSDRPAALIGSDFIFRPGVKLPFLEFLDAQRRIFLEPAIVHREMDEEF